MVTVMIFSGSSLKIFEQGARSELSDMGTPLEILSLFGGKPKYLQTLAELKEHLC